MAMMRGLARPKVLFSIECMWAPKGVALPQTSAALSTAICNATASTQHRGSTLCRHGLGVRREFGAGACVPSTVSSLSNTSSTNTSRSTPLIIVRSASTTPPDRKQPIPVHDDDHQALFEAYINANDDGSEENFFKFGFDDDDYTDDIPTTTPPPHPTKAPGRPNKPFDPTEHTHLNNRICASTEFSKSGDFAFAKNDPRLRNYNTKTRLFTSRKKPFNYWRNYFWFKKLLEQRNFKSLIEVKSYLRVHIDMGIATPHLFGLFLANTLRAADARKMIDEDMPRCHAAPDEFAYCALATKLLIEGDYKGATHVLKVEMPNAGVIQTSRTPQTLNLTNPLLSKLRQQTLRAIMADTGPVAQSEGEQYFQTLVNKGLLDEYLCSDMVGTTFTVDDACTMVFKTMAKANVKPSVYTFWLLIQKCVIWGDRQRAEEIHTMMKAAGFNEFVRRLKNPLHHGELQLAKLRFQELWRLFDRGTALSVQAAWALFQKHQSESNVGWRHCHVMLKHAASFQEGVKFVAGPMADIGIRPHIAIYTLLVELLQIEGNVQRAQDVAVNVIPATGLIPNDKFKEALALHTNPRALWSKRREKLKFLLSLGTPESIRQAEEIFVKLEKSGALTQQQKRQILSVPVRVE